MIRLWAHVLTFIFCFTVEVHVRAANLEEPSACLEKQIFPCAIFVKSGPLRIQHEGVELRLQRGAAVVLHKEKRVRLITGKLSVDAVKNQFLVETSYGDIAVNGGSVVMKLDSQSVNFFNVRNSVQFRPRGAAQFTALLAGFHQFMGRVDPTGYAKSGYGVPAVSSELIPLWAGFFQKEEVSRLRDELKAFRPEWKEAVDIAGPWYVETAQRQIASLEAEREKERRRREAIRKDQEFYREMFRRRNFMD